jgi:hypothetical protein
MYTFLTTGSNSQHESMILIQQVLMDIQTLDMMKQKKYLHFDFKGELLQNNYGELDVDKENI